MKRFVLCLAVWLLCGCVMADGREYVLVTVDTLWSQYAQGAVDFCITDAAEEMARYGVPAMSPNLTAIVQTCLNDAERLLHERGIETSPAPLPSVVPSGDGTFQKG